MPPAPINGNRYIDLLDELATFVSTQLGMTLGVNFFIGELPETGINSVANQDVIYFVATPAPAPDMYVDTETRMLDIYAVSSSSQTAKVLLRRIYDILQRKGNYTLVNWYVYFSYANSTIRDEDRTQEGSKLFSQSWTLICRNLNNIS